ncbi:F-actin-capping protein subunit beta [Phakopsora pachyrhizi]|uniref:F-actin-capping protein subunit beta n=1 Tax=Phakopsora pachyrhizi TaxID=170000 RepID=A0AAV0B9F8_PHAPC|nr:F-actin-capping protein subunit beta [Phakopsora pachyrhizi]CAH7682769.1 F-actin-capping protein subunit beta [Phakopsora pachyrhizi]
MDQILAQQPDNSELDLLLDLMRRLPPEKIECNLNDLIKILPHLTDDLLTSIDQPLKISVDPLSSKSFLNCDYNRDQDSYRSPWSNEYDPPISDGTLPSPKLRKLEIILNDAFDVYREMYYEGGVSSVYLWDLDEDFAGVILLKKSIEPSDRLSGSWDSIHVFETTERGRSAFYKLTSTVMLHLVQSNKPGSDQLSLSGSMTRQFEQSFPLTTPSTPNTLSPTHLSNIGKLIEEMELKMRNLLKEVYFSKTRDIVNDLRSSSSLTEQRKRVGVQRELVGLLKGKGQSIVPSSS